MPLGIRKKFASVYKQVLKIFSLWAELKDTRKPKEETNLGPQGLPETKPPPYKEHRTCVPTFTHIRTCKTHNTEIKSSQSTLHD